jgi:hypothetical protein
MGLIAVSTFALMLSASSSRDNDGDEQLER